MTTDTDKKQTFKPFLRSFFWSGIAALLAVILFTTTLDPFGLVGTPAIDGFNKIKPRMFFNARMIKAHQVSRFQPHGLILGSSRAETGLDPEHPGWAKSAYPVYNLSLPSARIYELYSYLVHAHASSPIRQVVMGLDFFSFDTEPISEIGFDSSRLRNRAGFLPKSQTIKDMLTGIISYNAIEASYTTLKEQNKVTFGYLRNGSQDTRRRREIVQAKGGHFAAFEATLQSIMLAEDGVTKLDYGHKSGEKANALKWFRKSIQFCINNQIELYLLISPLHAQWLELMWQLGAWSDYEQWKKDMVKIVETELDINERSVVELWDFSGFNSISTENVPGPNQTKVEMDWYWEASHYKRELGDLMLDRVLIGIQGSSPFEFGYRLSRNNIEQHLNRIRKERNQYVEKNQEKIVYLQNLIKKTLAES